MNDFDRLFKETSAVPHHWMPFVDQPWRTGGVTRMAHAYRVALMMYPGNPMSTGFDVWARALRALDTVEQIREFVS